MCTCITGVLHMYYRLWVTCVIHFRHHTCITCVLYIPYTCGTFPSVCCKLYTSRSYTKLPWSMSYKNRHNTCYTKRDPIIFQAVSRFLAKFTIHSSMVSSYPCLITPHIPLCPFWHNYINLYHKQFLQKHVKFCINYLAMFWQLYAI